MCKHPESSMVEVCDDVVCGECYGEALVSEPLVVAGNSGKALYQERLSRMVSEVGHGRYRWEYDAFVVEALAKYPDLVVPNF